MRNKVIQRSPAEMEVRSIASVRMTRTTLRPVYRDRHSNGLAQHPIGVGTILDSPANWTTCGVDVIASRFANSGHDTSVCQDSSEGLHVMHLNDAIREAGEWIKGNQIELLQEFSPSPSQSTGAHVHRCR